MGRFTGWLILRCNMGKVRDRFGGMGRFTGWLRGQKYSGVSLITALTS